LLSRVPEFSAIMASWLTGFLQQFEINSHLDMTSLIFWYREEFVQNLSTQLAKNGWAAFDIKMRSVLFGGRVKYVPTAAAVDVSVIVPTWNEEKYLPRCLLSLVDQKDTEPFEIIVVDGGSADQTVEIAEKYAGKVLVKPGLPVGAARNLGAEHAEGEILAFIDADTVASDHWLRAIANSFHGNPSAVGVTGPTYPYQGTLVDELVYRVATGWAQRLSLKLGFPHVAGFNCAYRKAAFWIANGFDEGRELSEDVMLGLRIRHEGRVLFNPEMVAYTSLRRIQQFGYAYLTTYYMINAIALLFFHENLGYPKVR
jgi:glycosyltransferase involved in cell wall biosynthesis